MAHIKFVTQDDEEMVLEANEGSIMELALHYAVPGIDGRCGGVCSCATCHVYVDEKYLDKVGEPADIEKDMLEFTDDVAPNSRLCCQINVTDDLDGITLTVARPPF